MPDDRHPRLTRADLPEEFTPETVRRLPMSTLRRLARPGNGILDAEEQARFDAVLHEVMTATAGRVSRQVNSRPDWAQVMRDASNRGSRRGRPGRPSGVDEQLSRLAQGIDQRVGAAEELAPGVDWSFAQTRERTPRKSPAEAAPPVTDQPSTDDKRTDQPIGAPPGDASGDPTGSDTETVSDLEQRLTEQVELVQVMSEIADVSKRTYALEQQRDLQSTRTVFFGFVVSVAVLVAGWAPIVAADDWSERIWILALTLATCVIAGVVYGLIRQRQNRRDSKAEAEDEAETA